MSGGYGAVVAREVSVVVSIDIGDYGEDFLLRVVDLAMPLERFVEPEPTLLSYGWCHPGVVITPASRVARHG